MCVTWVASPSALKHPINSAPSIALRQHVKHGQQNRSGRTISQPNGFQCRSTAAPPSPGNVSLGLAEACSRQCLYPVLTCRGLLKPLGLSCVLCIPALKQMSSSHFDTSLSLLQCIGYMCPRRGHKLGNDIWQTGASTSLTRFVPLTTSRDTSPFSDMLHTQVRFLPWHARHCFCILCARHDTIHTQRDSAAPPQNFVC